MGVYIKTDTGLYPAATVQGPTGPQGETGPAGSVDTVNGEPGPDVILSAADVGARENTWVPTFAEVTSKPAAYPPDVHSHDDVYFTEAEADARYKNIGEGVTDEELPARLRATLSEPPGGDWNLAVGTGYYVSEISSNAPAAGFWVARVEAFNDQWVTQTLYPISGSTLGVESDLGLYRRHKRANTWGNWFRLRGSESELDSRYAGIKPTPTARIGGKNLLRDASATDFTGWNTANNGTLAIQADWLNPNGAKVLKVTPANQDYSGVNVTVTGLVAGTPLVLTVWAYTGGVARTLNFAPDGATDGFTVTRWPQPYVGTDFNNIPLPAGEWTKFTITTKVSAGNVGTTWYLRTRTPAEVEPFYLSEPTVQVGTIATETPGISWQHADARYVPLGGPIPATLDTEVSGRFFNHTNTTPGGPGYWGRGYVLGDGWQAMQISYQNGVTGGYMQRITGDGGATWTPWKYVVVSEDSGWKGVGTPGEPAFENGWVNYGGGLASVAFRKIGNRVHLRGLAKDGVVSDTGGTTGNLFTLPEGYRPQAGLHFATSSNNAYGQVHVLSTGMVKAQYGSNVFFSLSGISFLVD